MVRLTARQTRASSSSHFITLSLQYKDDSEVQFGGFLLRDDFCTHFTDQNLFLNQFLGRNGSFTVFVTEVRDDTENEQFFNPHRAIPLKTVNFRVREKDAYISMKHVVNLVKTSGCFPTDNIC